MSRPRLGVTLFLVAAFASFLLSIALWFTDHREEGIFVGLWVPSILAAGGFWMAAVRHGDRSRGTARRRGVRRDGARGHRDDPDHAAR